MKTRMKKLFLLAIILLTPNLVQAASSCSYEEQAELNDIVANVKASYEVVEVYAGKTYDVDHPNADGTFPEVDKSTKAFKFNILNITDAVYVKVSNDKNEKVLTFKSTDTNNGVAEFQTSNKYELVTYTFEIYANKYQCIGELYRKFTVTTPIYNAYSRKDICKENPDFYYCQEFIPTENIPSEEFYDKINAYKEEKEKEEQQQEKNKSFFEKVKEFYNNHLILIYSASGVIITMGVATTVILVKKKRSRVL